MRFFTKIVFVCNVCFVLAIILRLIENANKHKSVFTGLIKLQPLESTVVVLGYGAILINFFFLVAYVVGRLFVNKQQSANWITIANLVLFVFQVFYFFFSN